MGRTSIRRTPSPLRLAGATVTIMMLGMLAPGGASAGQRLASSSRSPALATAADYPVAPPPFVLPGSGRAVHAPNAFGGTTVSLYRADGSLFARRVLDAKGRILETAYHFPDGTGIAVSATYLGRREARPRGPAGPLASCGTDSQNFTGHFWTQTMNWYWNQGSTPGNLDLTLTLSALRGARIEWESNVNWCGIADGSTMNFTYQGTTTASYGDNGINTVGWGNIAQTGCPAGSAACTRTEWDGSNHITEADTRMDASGNWANNGAANYADVQSVMAHETGHAIGFDHVTTSSNVMYPTIFLGDTSNRELGRGDANEDNAHY